MNREAVKTSRNLGAVLATQILSWAMTLAVLKVVPSYLNGSGYADLSTAGAFPAVLTALIMLGISSVLMREAAKDPSRTADLITAGVAIRIPLVVFSAFIGTGAAAALGYKASIIQLVVLGFAVLPVAMIIDVLNSVLQGLGDFRSTSLGLFCEKLVTSVLLVTLVIVKAPIVWFAVVNVFGATINGCIAWHALRRFRKQTGNPGFSGRINPETIRFLAKAGIPLMMGMIFHAFWEPVARILLSQLSVHVAVAWYDLAKRLNGTALFLPAALASVLMPSLSRQFHEDKDAFVQTARRLVQTTVLSAVPIAVVIAFGARRFIDIMGYPAEFQGTVPALSLLGAATGVWFLSQATGTILLASERQAVIGRLCMRLGVLIVPVSALGIWVGHRTPWIGNGAVGAIAADIILESTLLLGYVRALPEKVFSVRDLALVPRSLVASIPLAMATLWIEHLWQALVLAPAFVAYIAICVALRCISAGDVAAVKGLIEGFLRRRTATA